MDDSVMDLLNSYNHINTTVSFKSVSFCTSSIQTFSLKYVSFQSQRNFFFLGITQVQQYVCVCGYVLVILATLFNPQLRNFWHNIPHVTI